MTVTNPIDLPIGEYRFHCQAESDIQLPAYSGSAWRGLFGHALKRAVCVTRESDCKQCLLWRNCVYSYIFETPPPATTEVMRKYTAAPRPFIITPNPQQNRFVKKADSLWFDMTLIGKANQHLAYIIHALQTAGKQGIGKQRGQYSISRIEQRVAQTWETIYLPEQSLAQQPVQTPSAMPCEDGLITVTFMTPFRSVHEGKLLQKEAFQFAHFFSPLMRRVSMLRYFHHGKPLECDFKYLTELAKRTPLHQQQLEWFDWQRYSSRQHQRVSMGGLTGSFQVHSKHLAPFWEMMTLGQALHVGKGAVMGLGKYQLSHCAEQTEMVSSSEVCKVSA